MATLKAFKGIRPVKDKVSLVASRPYDVMTSEEARVEAGDNIYSFLHVVKPEIDLPEDLDHYAPQVYQKAKDNFAKLLKDGFAEDEIAAAKKTYIDDHTLARSQDAGLVRELARNAQYDWTMQRQADLEKKITSLTAAQLNAVVRKYMDPAAISYFKAGDFKKAGITQ